MIEVGPGWVLDASALLAYLRAEPGQDRVREALTAGCAVSAVNWAEVLSKLVEVGQNPTEAVERLAAGELLETLEIVSLTAEDGPAIAVLRPVTRRLGLSLADRACLALAGRLGVPALTADRAWSDPQLALGVAVELIR